MPSSEIATVLERTLARPAGAFRSALTEAIEEVRGLAASLDPESPELEDGGAECAAELGVFARDLIDCGRFGELFSDRREADPQARQRIQQALQALLEFNGSSELGRVEVSAGSNLHECVRSALERIGRVFGAARVAGLTRSGAYDPSIHDRLLAELPYARWSATERGIAPPLIVTGNGADLRAEGLAEFLDGRQKIVLLIREPAPAAPLARSISPATYVIQTNDPARLSEFAAFEGPGIAALVPDSAARFIHDPRAGATYADRLTIERLPGKADLKPLGGTSLAWQQDGLEHLRQLSACAGAHGADRSEATPPASPAAPIDRLAAWLVHHADLKDT
jgi:hypothetical protein